jgi:hypothetical protein
VPVAAREYDPVVVTGTLALDLLLDDVHSLKDRRSFHRPALGAWAVVAGDGEQASSPTSISPSVVPPGTTV